MKQTTHVQLHRHQDSVVLGLTLTNSGQCVPTMYLSADEALALAHKIQGLVDDIVDNEPSRGLKGTSVFTLDDTSREACADHILHR